MAHQRKIFKSFSWIVLSLLLVTISSTVYNIKILCGTCQQKTGCLGNICLKYTGDVQQEYCYGQSTCSSFSVQSSVTLGQCSIDQSGSTCQSGLCISSPTAQMCYGNYQSAQSCLDGITTTIRCSNRQMTYNSRGGIYDSYYGTNGYTFNMTMPNDCPFSYAKINYYRCSGDGMGTPCTCCSTATFEGLVTAYGNCVPQDSPLVQIKGDLKKYGYQTLLSLFLVLFQLILILI